jgi:hypothetical protein
VLLVAVVKPADSQNLSDDTPAGWLRLSGHGRMIDDNYFFRRDIHGNAAALEELLRQVTCEVSSEDTVSSEQTASKYR